MTDDELENLWAPGEPGGDCDCEHDKAVSALRFATAFQGVNLAGCGVGKLNRRSRTITFHG